MSDEDQRRELLKWMGRAVHYQRRAVFAGFVITVELVLVWSAISDLIGKAVGELIRRVFL